MKRGLFVAALAAVVLLPLAARADVPRSKPASSAEVTLVEYEVVLREDAPASQVAARLQAVAASVHGIATGVDASSRHAIVTLAKSRIEALKSDRRLVSVKEAAPGASGRTIVHLKQGGNVVPPWSRSYSYDAAGNITAMGADTFGYDGVSRLTSATVNNNVQTFTYDGFGNLMTATALTGKCIHGTDCAVNRTVDANTNRITAGTSTDCGNSGNGGTCYDQAGNLNTLDSTHTFTWDALSVMQRRSDAGVTQEYVYDANDERIGTYAGGAWSWTIRDVGNRVLSEYTSSGTTWTWQRDHIFRGSALVAAMTASGSMFHYHLDHLGTPRLITSNGTEAAFHTYLPFGAELSTAPVESPQEILKYTGHEFDDLGSVYSTFYMHARSDSATMGRFLSVDPVIKPGATKSPQLWNRYSYTANNPMNRVDRDGRNWFQIDGEWEWHKGRTYTTADGHKYTSDYTHLLVAQAVGTTKTGATQFKLTLYDQNKIVGTGTYFSGGGGHMRLPDGNYTIRGDIKDLHGPDAINPNSPLKNPPVFYGMQVIRNEALRDPSTGDYYDAYGAYGPIRAYLNPWDPSVPGSTGNYLHGQAATGPSAHGYTHGCLCYGQDTTIVNYLWKLGERVPVSVDQGVTPP